MHKGMAAWMRAWSRCSMSGEDGGAAGDRDGPPIPGELRGEIVTIMAGMVLGHCQEAVS
jgi:hypothetical protein